MRGAPGLNTTIGRPLLDFDPYVATEPGPPTSLCDLCVSGPLW